METRANYVLVGALTLGIAALAMIFALWFARAQFNAEYAIYDIVFKGPVRGLAKGGEVRFNGIKVGEITTLELDKKDKTLVVARVRVEADTPLTTSSEARLEAMGLTGVNLIQLTAGDPKDPPLPRKRNPPTRIQATKGALDDLVAAGQDIASNANRALVAVQSVLSDENVKRLNETIRHIDETTAMLAARDGAIAQSAETVKALHAAADSVRRLSDDTNARLARIEAKTDAILNESQRAATAVADAADGARRFTTSAADAADIAAYQALPDISTAARDLRRLSQSLDRLAGQVESSGPTSLVGGRAARPTIKVKP
ncbi:MAG: MlaD family protein [Hyphomonadaceae bacterium]